MTSPYAVGLHANSQILYNMQNIYSDKAKLESLFSGLKSGLDAYKSIRGIYNEKMAFDFNSLDFFRPGENKISELLGFYLNPKQTHGQGDSFLRALLQRKDLGDAYNLYRGEAQVYLEFATDEKRRIDIVIEIGDGDFYIGIENKVGTACDQFNQLSDYSTYLHNISKQNYFLFYLTPSGHEPSEYSLREEELNDLKKNNKFSTLSYEDDIIELFTIFESVCKADNVRAFTRDLNQHLKKRFRGEKFMNESNYITSFLEGSPEHQNTALDVVYSQWTILEQLYQGLKFDLSSHYSGQYKIKMPETVQDAIKGNKHINLISLSKPDWKHTNVEFQFGNTFGKGIFHGISHQHHNGKLAAVENEQIQLLEPPHEWWVTQKIWENYQDWYDSGDPWRKMIKHRNESSALFQEMSEIIDGYFKALENVEQYLL